MIERLILRLEQIDIIIMPQELSLDIADLMRDVTVHEKRMTAALWHVGSQISAGLEEASMLHAALSDDMGRTAELFAKLFGQQQMELRWEVTEHQSCHKFHCDNVYIVSRICGYILARIAFLTGDIGRFLAFFGS